MSSQQQVVEVWADWESLGGAVRVGMFRAIASRGRQVFSFEYDELWLKSGGKVALDPELQPVRGPQYAIGSGANFGVFLDSAPDRWGRVLMQRREALAVVKTWPREATKAKLSRSEQDRMASAFRLAAQ
jgi:serine/threonine-protein kinase HipA